MSPAKVEVLTGTTFLCNGIKCQLLGVRDAHDVVTQAKAAQFCRDWFDKSGGYITFENANYPLEDTEGVPTVWAAVYDSRRSSLNVALVEAGLVEIDVVRWSEYSFSLPRMGGGQILIDWPSILKDARIRAEGTMDSGQMKTEVKRTSAWP
jgi:hypothetical protein